MSGGAKVKFTDLVITTWLQKAYRPDISRKR